MTEEGIPYVEDNGFVPCPGCNASRPITYATLFGDQGDCRQCGVLHPLRQVPNPQRVADLEKVLDKSLKQGLTRIGILPTQKERERHADGLAQNHD